MAYLIPWKRSEIVALRRQIDHVCERFFSDLSERFCRSELLTDWHFSEAEDHFLLAIEMPELNPDDLEVTVTADTLSIQASKEAAAPQPGEACRRRCRALREVKLPARIDAERVEATYAEGVLKIVLPKTARGSRVIPIRGSA